ncbi:MAG: hypothetical protein LBD30_00285 [Verrucomicrobiales bacterium]|jgi:hypothetical protein|nr:hypothetical protein [Verrucomicrobiales bacterium]
MHKKTKKINDGFEDFIPDDYDPFKAKTLTRAEELTLGIPAPGEIARQIRLQRVTLNLEAASVRFFKQQAAQCDIPYQTLLREVLNRYVARAA